MKDLIGFATIIAAGVAIWFVTPAGAQEYDAYGNDSAYAGGLGDYHYNQPNQGVYGIPYYRNPEPVHQPGPVICNNLRGVGTMCQQY